MRDIKLTADTLVASLLKISESEPVCILDSCGVGHLGSHLLIAGVRPAEVVEVSNDDPSKTLELLNAKFATDQAAMFTLSYDLGIKLQETSQKPTPPDAEEPDLFLALFDVLVIHDYDSGKTSLSGSEDRFDEIAKLIREHQVDPPDADLKEGKTPATFESNFTKAEYVAAVERIHELIRRGDTYQVNLTQQLRCAIPPRSSPGTIFQRLRRDHPAPFAAFFKRKTSTVVSASPERFFRVTRDGMIESSPIKGTRRRGVNPDEDDRLRLELQSSQKDRAENTMIVDLVRNDLGRVCEFGSVTVEKLCEIEEHPTLFHLVSTVRGKLREQVRFSEILRAVFPCGSITGAPKIRTMQIIDDIEPADRGLSMGAIGVYIPEAFGTALDTIFDLSVAIRTMVIRDHDVVFNVGGGIVIDSEPEKEFEESILKAVALLRSIRNS